jgi:importin-5
LFSIFQDLIFINFQSLAVQPLQDEAGTAWPELLALTTSLCARQADPVLLETGLTLVDKLCEYSPGSLTAHVTGLTQVFAISLVHSHATVRMAALRAACSLLQDLPPTLPADTIASAAALVPPMLKVIESAVTEGDEDAACIALDAIRAIADSRPALLKPSLALIARAVLTIAGASSLAASTRQMALELLVTFCEKAPAALRKGGTQIVSAVIPLVLDMLAQVENDDDNSNSNDDSNNESEWVLKADPSAWSNECGTAANDDDEEDEVS